MDFKLYQDELSVHFYQTTWFPASRLMWRQLAVLKHWYSFTRLYDDVC